MKILLFAAMLLLSNISQAQERRYFTNFKEVDSVSGYPIFGCFWGEYDRIAVSVKRTKDTLIKGMECTLFEIAYGSDKVNIWLGIKNDRLYSFRKNNLAKPVEMFSFTEKQVHAENVYCYPFSKKATVLELFNSSPPEDRYFRIDPGKLKVGDLTIYSLTISPTRGLFFDARLPRGDADYSNLDEI